MTPEDIKTYAEQIAKEQGIALHNPAFWDIVNDMLMDTYAMVGLAASKGPTPQYLLEIKGQREFADMLMEVSIWYVREYPALARLVRKSNIVRH